MGYNYLMTKNMPILTNDEECLKFLEGMNSLYNMDEDEPVDEWEELHTNDLWKLENFLWEGKFIQSEWNSTFRDVIDNELKHRAR